MPEVHELMGGKVQVYKRDNSRHWQCSASIAGRQWRKTTKEESLSHAKDFAEDWYLELKGKSRAGVLKAGKTFKIAAQKFQEEYEVITEGQRNVQYVEQHWQRLRVHLIPFFGNMTLKEITPGVVNEYRVQRHKVAKETRGAAPARNTLHQEMVTLRQVLKTAYRHGWIDYVPDISEPYKTNAKIGHRGWFSPEEYKKLYTATRDRAENPRHQKEIVKRGSKELHDYVLFMANTGLRPDEANRLQFRDVTIVDDEATSQRILEIEVRGKRGYGYCKSMPGAVLPFERLHERNMKSENDLVFRNFPREMFKNVLNEQDLRIDREGNRRTAYSLRHTYISMRLLEGADIYQIAKNCRTSVEMIQKHYAVHLKNMLDTKAINIMKAKPRVRNVTGAKAKTPQKAPPRSRTA
jgi:integrase